MAENKLDLNNLFKAIREIFKGTKSESKIKQILAYAAGILLLLGVGFFGGRQTIKHGEGTEVIYMPGDTMYLPSEPHDSIIEKPIYITKPVDTADIIVDCIKNGKFSDLFPTKDSVIYITKEDTSAVIRDWATERVYQYKAFDIDTIGSATVEAKAQYNRITWIGTTFVPTTKQVTVNHIIGKKYSPFIGGGITTMPELVVNGGMYFDDKYGASILYEYDWTRNKHAVGVMGTIKF